MYIKGTLRFTDFVPVFRSECKTGRNSIIISASFTIFKTNYAIYNFTAFFYRKDLRRKCSMIDLGVINKVSNFLNMEGAAFSYVRYRNR